MGKDSPFTKFITLSGLQVDLNGLFNRRVYVVLTWVLTEHEIHRESSTGNDENRNIAEKIGKFGRVHRSRRNDQFQVLSTTDHLKLNSLSISEITGIFKN